MKFLLIPDKFKNSITADGVNIAIAKGLKNCYNDAKLFSILASDGGDGFLDAINYHLSLEKVFIETVNPLGKKINAFFLYDGIKNVAYIELAKASGVELLETEELDVRNASTLGTGYQIKEAIQLGAKKIIIGLGGSATNDAGIGIAYALGYRFKDSSGNELYPSGKNLALISEIVNNNSISNLNEISFFAVNDVTNPLYGQHGAAYIYAKQKGATNEVIELLDLGLKKFSKIVEKFIGTDISEMEGTGAAGGSAFGLKAFFNAEFIRGVDFLFELAKIPEILNNNTIDYIITGEGKIDYQTLNGKLIKGILDIGKKKSIPVLAVCGISELSNEELKTEGFADVLQIHESNMSISYSMNNASKLIESKVYDYFKKNSK
tara:strand:+ start:393 stop:1526 length:1134 start_codon:yes stop_codon:yes gene_type:complete